MLHRSFRPASIRPARVRGGQCTSRSRHASSIGGGPVHLAHLNPGCIVGRFCLLYPIVHGTVDIGGGSTASPNLAHIPGNPLTHGLAFVHLSVDAPPPGRFTRDAQFPVSGSPTKSALPDQVLVLVGVDEARDDLNKHNQQARRVSSNKNGDIVSGDVEGRVLEPPCGQGLEGHDEERNGNDELEAVRGKPDETNGAVEEAPVSFAVVLDGVAQVEGNGKPAGEQHEGSALEAAVGGAWGGVALGLLDGSLKFNVAPVAGDDQEEVEPPPEIEEQRHPELESRPLVVHGQGEGVGIDVLPLHPASPVPDSLPDAGQGTHVEQHPEEGGDDDGDLRQVVSVDVDANNQADEAGDRHGNHPVPLPPPADRSESLLGREIHAAVPGEVHEGEHQANAVDGSKGDADEAARVDGIDGRVAGGHVDKAAIGKDIGGLVGWKGQEAPAVGAVGHCAIGIEGVVPVFEGGQVEVDAANDGVGGVVAARPGHNVPGVEDGHIDWLFVASFFTQSL